VGSRRGTAEFLEARCTAQPGLTEVAPAHEEEAAGASADTEVQRGVNGGLHVAPGLPHPEQWQCLSEDMGSRHHGNRLLQLCVVANPVDGSSDH